MNSLPESIRAIRSIGEFKKEINHLILTRQSCTSVFMIILIFINSSNVIEMLLFY